MKIILTDNITGNQVNGEVADDNWVGNAIEATFYWMRHRCAESVTVREYDGSNGNPRIATLTMEIHDE